MIVLLFSFYTGWIKNYPLMGIAFVTFILLVMIVTSDKFKEVNATLTGIKLVMKEAEQVIKDAEVTMEQLRDLGEALIETELSTIMRSSRMQAFSYERAENTRDRLSDKLDNLEVSKEKQHAFLMSEWYPYYFCDMSISILDSVIKYKYHDRQIEITDEMKEEARALHPRSIGGEPSPKELRDYFEKWSILTPHIDEFIKDYEFFYDRQEFRDLSRKDLWFESGPQGWQNVKLFDSTE